MAVRGMNRHVLGLPAMVIWMLSNGVEKMDVHGMNKLVLVLLEMDIWKY
jgi:hypothetical protein